MKTLFLGANDWANVSNRVARAMNAAAGKAVARVITANPHPFGYREDRMSVDDPWLKDVDWIVATGDGDYRAFSALTQMVAVDRYHVRFAAAHVGSAYRLQYEHYNKLDERQFEVRFIGADLLRLCDDPRAIPYFAPPDTIAAELPPLEGRIRIGHSPTSREKKGTEDILRVLDDLRGDADIDLIENVTYDECAERRAKCHIFVDQLSTIGGFGASSVEALAAGCVVLADIHNVIPRCWEFFPRPPIVDVRSPVELRSILRRLLESPDELQKGRSAALKWAQEHASPKAIAGYWSRPLLDASARIP